MIGIFPLAAILLRDHPLEKASVADEPFLTAAERDDLAEKEGAALRTGNGAPVSAPFWKRVFSLRF